MGRAPTGLGATPTGGADNPEELGRRLTEVATQCGDVSFLIENVAMALKTGMDPNGRPSMHREETNALIVAADVLAGNGMRAQAAEILHVAAQIRRLPP